MQMKVKTPTGTISALYLRDASGNAVGIHAGLFGRDSVVSLEYSNKYGGMALVINHNALDACGIKLVSVVGGRDILNEMEL